MRKIRFSLFLGLLTASTPLLADILVQPATNSVTAGQTFTLSVDISAVTDLYGYQFDVGFDPTVLEALSVSEGSFLPTGGATFFIPGTIDNVGGTISANADILEGAVSGVSGSGDLLDVSFLALAAGSSSVDVFNVLALNSLGQGIALTTTGADITVTAAPVPEPASSLLLATIAVWLIGRLLRKRGFSFRP